MLGLTPKHVIKVTWKSWKKAICFCPFKRPGKTSSDVTTVQHIVNVILPSCYDSFLAMHLNHVSAQLYLQCVNVLL